MATRPQVHPADTMNEYPPPVLSGGRRFLAEGDSWFTLGTLKGSDLSNLLFELNLSSSAQVLNCAYPGDTLQHMVDSVDRSAFNKLLYLPGFEHQWDAILLSAGGNDFIDATATPLTDRHGELTAAKKRILLRPDEVANSTATGPERYISATGWQTLTGYLLQNFRAVASRRDQGQNHERPIFVHTYAKPTVRPSGVLPWDQGWLYPAFEKYGVPSESRQQVCDFLFEKLRLFMLSLDQDSRSSNAIAKLHVFDSASMTEIRPAESDQKGKSGDWINEIHLTPKGYRKLGKEFGKMIESVLKTYPPRS
ncbi:hypothetical protein LMG3410_00542 [Achromobacter aegrifaciens]|uniref:SGNH hydrolase-type esterase domain-containing protein n=1 Tax=Achromobacter aegrifaciens TaxID=1287736 RepID=A0AAD2KMA1_ACHAE|nr:hypothetical protein [Achromobacter aegrifaciens]MDR7949522.1 hypothetical protein [Achromobacter aegrifaciens]CAB3826647.1 hypothetical protein LMG3410_00542 [Achromobacter aegrifaciens]CUJ77289.1 Uncharacterised protein [Achromobacter aegrifaciens]